MQGEKDLATVPGGLPPSWHHGHGDDQESQVWAMWAAGTPKTPSLWDHRDIQFCPCADPPSLILRSPSEPGPCGPVGTPPDWSLSDPQSLALIPMGLQGLPEPGPYGNPKALSPWVPPNAAAGLQARSLAQDIGRARPRGHQPGTEPLGPPSPHGTCRGSPLGARCVVGGTGPPPLPSLPAASREPPRTQGHGDGATSAPGTQTPTFTL